MVDRVLPLGYGVLYVALLAAASPPEGAGFGSIAEVRALFASDAALAAGWVHYLAFDLFVGAWIARDARALGLSHGATLPALVLTLVFGPFGLLLHLLRRGLSGRGWAL